MLAGYLAGAQVSPCPPWPPGAKKATVGIMGQDTLTPDSAGQKFVRITEQQVMLARQVWSFLDFKEKINKVTYNNSNLKSNIYPLYEVLNLWIALGKVNCFRQSAFGSAKNIPLTRAEFKRLAIRRDTVEERRIDENGEEHIIREMRADTLTSEKIVGFAIMEDWFFNKRSVLMERKIIGLAPVAYDKQLQKNRELYWVYYPECCELLSSYFTVNPSGAAEPYTYREALDKRYFSAYVLKESNIYNRDKPENSKGFEVEYENKKNRERFESTEEDLWSK